MTTDFEYLEIIIFLKAMYEIPQRFTLQITGASGLRTMRVYGQAVQNHSHECVKHPRHSWTHALIVNQD